MADSRGSQCSPKAGFGRIRLLPRRAAYGLSCELTQPAITSPSAFAPRLPRSGRSTGPLSSIRRSLAGSVSQLRVPSVCHCRVGALLRILPSRRTSRWLISTAQEDGVLGASASLPRDVDGAPKQRRHTGRTVLHEENGMKTRTPRRWAGSRLHSKGAMLRSYTRGREPWLNRGRKRPHG